MLAEDWLFCPKPNPSAKISLICFSYAGGGASKFVSWPNHLPAEIELYAVQLPGRENRFGEPLFTQLSDLIKTLMASLGPMFTTPFAFFGHSLGALISFEFARELRKNEMPGPIHLFVSGHRAPQLTDPAPPVHNLPISELLRELRKLNGIPEIVLRNSELMGLALPALRADLEMSETYVYSRQAPLECPISAFGGRQDPRVNRKALEGWQEQTNNCFTIRMLPGDHFFLHSSRARLLQEISWQLQQHDI